ncbi:hypothetical protein [Methanoplanus limicola]|uniref:Uncharacterized protein n=1 Tax=Methanoplanus limicola DSM 2279 TaxID=937775 RepID=H1Z1G3_9EURY|nr:hypothetical protein [Methanoplanus limicola]EHQ36310.1 hypothetical protein Metlim_2251 [Methanoplanus limicola DSM 2279]
MDVTGCSNGSPDIKTGSGYGIRIKSKDRDLFFQKEWNSVEVIIDSEKFIEVSISKSFWNTCIELKSKEIGRWMLDNNHAPWPKYKTPKFKLEPSENRRFILTNNQK